MKDCKQPFPFSTADEWFSYDPETGVITWKRRPGDKMVVGSRAGTTSSWGYIAIKFQGNLYMGHRLAWLLYYKEWPKMHIDHINGDPSDNRIQNLRDCPVNINLMNLKRPKLNTSGRQGVCRSKSKSKPYRAYIRRDGVCTHLGHFHTFEEAVQAREDAEPAEIKLSRRIRLEEGVPSRFP